MLDSISHSPWFLIGLCLAMALVFSGFILYGLMKKKVWLGVAPVRGQWGRVVGKENMYFLYLLFIKEMKLK